MSKLQKNGRQREGDEEKGGKTWKVGYKVIRSKSCNLLFFLFSWTQEKASRKAAMRQLKNKLKRGMI